MQYIDWLCGVIDDEQPDTIIFLGDWFDNRSRIRSDTLEYGIRAAVQLSEKAEEHSATIWWLVGNHDMFYKQKRSTTSLSWLHLLKNVNVIKEPMETRNVFFSPWLLGTEYLEVVDAEVEYVFGHFELPTFLMNEQVECPDIKGGIHSDMFHACAAVFSGHFHKRQTKINPNGIPVTYIGNCFPHNFNDVGDRDRGCMVLTWGEEPIYLNFPGPNYNRIDLSELLELADKGTLQETFDEKSVVECYDDLNIAQEEALEVKETLRTFLRDVTLKPNRDKLKVSDETEVKKEGKTVDQIVLDHIKNLDTEGSDIDVHTLLEVYKLSDE